ADDGWYSIVTCICLELGDFCFDCTVVEATFEQPLPETGQVLLYGIAKRYDIIVLTQSCDLLQGKIESVLVCPIWTLNEMIERYGKDLATDNGKEQIRRGNVHGLYMLNVCEETNFTAPLRIVSFRQVFSLPFGYVNILTQKVGPR